MPYGINGNYESSYEPPDVYYEDRRGERRTHQDNISDAADVIVDKLADICHENKFYAGSAGTGSVLKSAEAGKLQFLIKIQCSN